MVVFKKGEPATADYRQFRLKTTQGTMDDYKSLSEVIRQHINYLPDVLPDGYKIEKAKKVDSDFIKKTWDVIEDFDIKKYYIIRKGKIIVATGFRDLLAATVRHPAMLIYLDNNRNAVGRINENYAREIMELHTLGVGSGYTQGDVQELSRILTGVGVNLTSNTPNVRPMLRSQFVRDGLFVFNPNRHDYGDKTFLGQHIVGSGLAEVNRAVDILSRAPATSRFISRKLALYFVSDNPPSALVERMAATSARPTERLRRSEDDVQIARVQGLARYAVQGPDPFRGFRRQARL